MLGSLAIDYQSLSSVVEEARDLSVGDSAYSVTIELMYKQAVVDPVKSLGKIHHDDVSCGGAAFHRCGNLFDKLEELCFARFLQKLCCWYQGGAWWRRRW